MLYQLQQNDSLVELKLVLAFACFLAAFAVYMYQRQETDSSQKANSLSEPLRVDEESEEEDWTVLNVGVGVEKHDEFLFFKRMVLTASVLMVLFLLLFIISMVFKLNPVEVGECSLTEWKPVISTMWAVYGPYVPSTQSLRNAASSLTWAFTFAHSPSVILPTPHDFDTSSVTTSRKRPFLVAMSMSIAGGIMVISIVRLTCNAFAKMTRNHFTNRLRLMECDMSTKVRCAFWPYYVALNLALYVMVDVSLVRGFVGSASGLDWEVWMLWVLLIFGVQVLSLIIVYFITGFRTIVASEIDVFMGFAPIIGSDWHIMKDHLFVGIIMQQAQCATGILALALKGIGYLHLLWLYGHIVLYFNDENNIEAALLQSHLPFVSRALCEAVPEEAAANPEADAEAISVVERMRRACAGAVTKLRRACAGAVPRMRQACADAFQSIPVKMASLAAKASTLDKEKRAYAAELPMAIFGILGLFLGVGETFVMFSIVTSLVKAAAAPLLREQLVPTSLIEFLDDGSLETWIKNVSRRGLLKGLNPEKVAAQPRLVRLAERVEKTQKGLLIEVLSAKGGSREQTPLMFAAMEGNEKCVTAILQAAQQHGLLAEVLRATGYNGWTPLMFAAQFGHDQCVTFLLQAAEQQGLLAEALRAVSQSGRTPLMYAAENGHDRCLSDLLEAADKQGILPEVLRASDDYGQTPLMRAAYNGHERCMSDLLQAADKQGILLEVLSATDILDRTPLMIAASVGCEQSVTFLLQAAARHGLLAEALRAVDQSGYTPLMYAAMQRHDRCLSDLLEAADKQAILPEVLRASNNFGNTPLNVAAMNGHDRCVSDLLQAADKQDILPEVLRATSDTGITPLMFAAQYGRDQCVTFLLQAAKQQGLLAEVLHAKDNGDDTALMYAEQQRNASCVALLRAAEQQCLMPEAKKDAEEKATKDTELLPRAPRSKTASNFEIRRYRM